MSSTPEAGETPDAAEPPETAEESETEAMPETAETGKRRAGRLGWDAVLAVVVVVWMVALGIAVVRRSTSGADAAPARAATMDVPPATEPPTAEQIADTIEIETGFTPGEVVACDSPAGQATGWYPSAELCPPEQRAVIGETVSYAIVLENTGDHVLRNIQLGYRFLDGQGQVIREPNVVFNDGELDRQEASVAVLRPGESFAVSNAEYLERNDVAEIEVEIDEVSEWIPAEYHEHADPMAAMNGSDLTATDIAVSYGTMNEPVVSFTVESTGDRAVTIHFAYIVFRNAAGEIIGGTYGYVSSDYRPLTVQPGGSVESEISVDDPMEIPGIDPAQTEVHLSGQFVLM
jgi:hypothetical protein